MRSEVRLDALTAATQVAAMNGPSHLNRRLSALVFADVAGFSRLIAANEAETLRQWNALRTEIIEVYTAQHGGRVVEIAGDAALVEFPSAVNSVRWAVDVQKAVKSWRAEPASQAIHLRVGINVEDVIYEDGLLQGDGVVIAARVHQAAEPGQIVVTAPVRDYVVNRLPVTFHDLGTPPLKNIARPVHIFAVAWSDALTGEATLHPYLHWSTRPTIAVLPFRSTGGTEAESYFGEGITEDIITGLSRSRALYVIAHTSTLRYRDRTTDLRQIAGELDVRYILNGSVRRRGTRLRITAELTDVAANRPVWAERYDGANDDLFEFQDRIVASIVGSLEPRLLAAEVARARGRPTESLDAYDCVLRALSRLYLFTDDSFRETAELLERAIALDPGYAQAYAYTAWRLNFWIGEMRSSDLAADGARALEAARKAVALDPEDAFALTVSGHVTSFIGRRPNEAMDCFDAALEINENSSFAWAMSALTLTYQGRPDEALERMRNAWRLNPFGPLNFYFWFVAGLIEFVAGRYGEAVAWLRKSRRANPRFAAGLRTLAASSAMAGDEAGARSAGQELLAIDPSFRVSSFIAWYPLQRPDDLRRLQTALSAVGLPD